MRTSLLKLIQKGFLFAIIFGIVVGPLTIFAQDAGEVSDQDTVEVIEDNSSSFNDSVQVDDMEPIFYEAAEDESTSEEGSNIQMYLIVGIAIVLIVVLVVLKKAGKKKA